MNAQPIELKEVFRAAGNKAKLARELGIHKSAVSQWRRVPHERAKAVSELTGIPLFKLRPDLWEAPA